MYAEERQQEIVRLARTEGRVEVTQLAETLNVTAETVRRDLTTLERAGVIRRVHGGAIPIERIGFERAVTDRDTVLTEEKERIAKSALAEIPEDGAVILDAGTTTARMAQLMPTDRELTVVVNSPVLATVLSVKENLTVLLLGGRVRGKTLATVDEWALRCLSELYVDVAFMGTNGITVEHGLTTPHQAEATVKRAMIRSARRVVLLADHTKVGHDHMARFGELSDVDLMITDAEVDADLAAELEVAGVRLSRA
ncbi:MAG TPA: DeoR/GlpR family DNA-binding transcription regulator [Stackebrandtia sp.]|jgi:DeoR family fructose operon transcriptional repressor|uniref:DeoR/GlpR family DNA-binding transcription regulator n=1 Tax=Stackebrandtia sp. TaxID=2023065 RepID=UPI002D567934|nr:DeoR/GlpR family DNA-binding transcription regulator [Stackebrandtia sp.]HZE37968.1 DeoR/GlpR family DNA-binding transcription regulator [Stackebrandtia sp.]